jgi:ABC-2 type transport system ATP-binding protein
VKNLNFSIGAGETLGFIGLNGAGKSTTIKILTGLMVPTSGRCVVNGMIPHENRNVYTKNIGVVFGNRSQLWWDLPVSESFSVLKKIYKIPGEVYQSNLKYLTDLLELDEFYLTAVRNLSLGQKMRADLAASLLHNPCVLFLDEPTIGLDVFAKEKIRQALKYINSNFNTTLLLTTHDLDDIEEICEKILIIDKGEVIFHDMLGELKKSYGNQSLLTVELIDKNSIDISGADCPFTSALTQKQVADKVVTISFKDSEINLPELMKFIVTRYQVKDLSIKKPELEDIIKSI